MYRLYYLRKITFFFSRYHRDLSDDEWPRIPTSKSRELLVLRDDEWEDDMDDDIIEKGTQLT
jgi:hypothetical protein